MVRRSSTLCDRFARIAAERSDAVAVTDASSSVTYGALDAASNRLAAALLDAGVGAGSIVGICLPRTADVVVAVLGVLKTGAAYLPLDPENPAARLRFMVSDAGATVVLVDPGTAHLVSGDRVTTLEIPSGGDVVPGRPDAPAPAPGDPAYVIYTSGSTGTPKGVVVRHENVTRLFDATEAAFEFSGDDVWTLFHSYAFDFSVWEIWGALTYGGRLVVVPSDVVRSPQRLWELIAAEGVTVFNQTPSFFEQMAAAARAPELAGSARSLRYVVFGGEALDVRKLTAWVAEHGDSAPELVNMYGITETTVHVTAHRVTRADVESGNNVIGPPLPDLSFHVLSESGEASPAGEPGEIHVGGAGVATGYLGRPDLTAARFVPDPFSEVPGARLYRSGDLARVRDDGEVEFLGRSDHQVKIRGYRIEPDEAAVNLLTNDCVRHAAVVAHDSGEEPAKLVAYVVPGDPAPTVEEMREHLAARVPDYLVPAAFVFLPELPLTVNGKLDRAALPPPPAERPEVAAPAEAPENELEQRLTRMWEDVLGVRGIGRDDDFFVLGGDSIQTIRVTSLAAEQGLDVHVEDVFRFPTIAELAAFLEEERNAEAAAVRPSAPFSQLDEDERAGVPDDADDAYPLTELQLGMLFHTESSGRGQVSPYWNLNTLRVHAPFDEDRMRDALAAAAAAHDVLRTSFELFRGRRPLQIVHRTVTIPLDVADVRREPVQAQRAAVDDWIQRERRRRADPGTPPLLRFQVHVLTDDSFQMSWTEHHALLDGWSSSSMLAEVLSRFGGLGWPDERPQLRFADYVALERAALASEEARAFWTRTLEDAPAGNLPLRAGGRPGGGVEVAPVHVDPGLLAALRESASLFGTTVRSLIAAAHAGLLATVSGRSRVVSGHVFNGRPDVGGGEHVLGLFLNSAPLVVDVDGSWIEVAHRMEDAERAAYPYRRFPLAEIQRMLGRPALLDIILYFTQFHVLGRLSEAGLADVREWADFAETDFPLMTDASVDAAGSSLVVNLHLDTRRLRGREVDAYPLLFETALRRIAEGAASPWDAEALLPPAEARRVVELATSAADAHVEPALASIRRRVEGEGARVAIAGEAGELTYADVGALSGAIAGRLVDAGAGPDEVVAIAVGRTVHLPVAELGVLRAGAAMLPLDLSQPDERIALMLQSARVRIAVADEAGARRLAGLGVEIVPAGAEGEGEGPWAETFPEALAYVLYTSGSTGVPKGTGVPHSALSNLVHAAVRELVLGEDDVVLALTSPSFDISLVELVAPLAAGARIEVVPDAERLDTPRIIERIEGHGVTFVQGTPSRLRTLVAAGWRGPAKVLSGGEVLPAPLAQELRAGGCEVWNGYGPTEAAIYTTFHRVTGSGDRAVPIGRPLPGVVAVPSTPWMTPMPAGSPGELMIGGLGLARGYVGRPDLTAERFVPDAFSGVPGARVYRSGDLVSLGDDGALCYMGRLDDQVKIRGVRVEPGEVENALSRHPAVDGAVVVPRQTDETVKLIAYAVAGEDAVSEATLREFLGKSLPAAFVPSRFVFLDRFPTTASGKVDKSKLPPPPEDGTDGFEAPRGRMETLIAGAWAETLGDARASANDDFFDVGGDSLSLMTLVAAIEQRGLDVDVRAIMKNPTIRGIARYATQSQPEGAGRR